MVAIGKKWGWKIPHYRKLANKGSEHPPGGTTAIRIEGLHGE